MSVRTVNFWIKAFIPDPSASEYVVPAPGASAGLSMIVVPDLMTGLPVPTLRAFLGDNRGFTSDIAASARIHGSIIIEALDTDAPAIQSQDIHCGESLEVDRQSGEVIARATAPTDRIRFLNLRGNSSVDPEGGISNDGNASLVQVDFEAAANLPLLGGSPDIDMVGVLGIDRDANTVRFNGSVDGFPAFEAYVSADDGSAVMLLQMKPVSPIELVGDVKRPVDVTVSLS